MPVTLNEVKGAMLAWPPSLLRVTLLPPAYARRLVPGPPARTPAGASTLPGLLHRDHLHHYHLRLSLRISHRRLQGRGVGILHDEDERGLLPRSCEKRFGKPGSRWRCRRTAPGGKPGSMPGRGGPGSERGVASAPYSFTSIPSVSSNEALTPQPPKFSVTANQSSLSPFLIGRYSSSNRPIVPRNR